MEQKKFFMGILAITATTTWAMQLPPSFNLEAAIGNLMMAYTTNQPTSPALQKLQEAKTSFFLEFCGVAQTTSSKINAFAFYEQGQHLLRCEQKKCTNLERTTLNNLYLLALKNGHIDYPKNITLKNLKQFHKSLTGSPLAKSCLCCEEQQTKS